MAEKKIVISVKSVKLKNGQAEVNINATGTDENKAPLKNKTAKLFLADVEKTEAETTTNDKGVACFNFEASCINKLPVRVEIDGFKSDKREINTTSEYEKKKDDGKGSDSEGKESKGGKTAIRPFIDEITKTSTGFTVPIEVRVSRGDAPVEGADVFFRKGTKDIPGSNKKTNSRGEAIYDHHEPLDAAGKTIELRAMVDGTTAETPVRFELPKEPEKPKKPEARYAEIKELGRDGNYRLTVQILDGCNKGGKFTVILSETPESGATTILQGSNPLTIETDEQGYADVSLTSFTEKRRTIFVRVKGTDIDRKIVLSGPSQPFFKGDVLKGKGFLGNLFRKKTTTP